MDNCSNQLDKLEFDGESPLTTRARCRAFRYCPDPLGIVTAEVLDKLAKLMGTHIFNKCCCFRPIFYSPVFKIPFIHV